MLRLRQALAFTLIWTQCVLLSPLFGYAQGSGDTSSTQPTAAELDQLVAPIALYPDSLVGQILAASSYPTQIVEAQRWLQNNAGQSATQIAQAADSQPWDPSVKSLTAFPKVLDNMDTNLAWTSALGEAYYSDPQGVLKAIQVMRARAQTAGSLKSSSQQTIVTQGQTIIIAPADPQVIYVPQYNPTVVYGAPVAPYPGYSGADLALTGVLAFGAGIAVGALISSSDGWGSNNWNCNWHGGNVSYNHNVYVSNSNNYRGWNSSSANWNKNNNTWNKSNNSWNKSNNNWNKNNSNWNKNSSNWNKNSSNRNNGSHSQAKNDFNKDQNRNQAESNFNKNQDRNQAKNASNKSGSNYSKSDRGYGASSGQTHSNAFGGSRPGGQTWADSDRGRSSSGGGGSRGGGFGGGGFGGGRGGRR
jgi:Protein of unknown function (DUF3300)